MSAPVSFSQFQSALAEASASTVGLWREALLARFDAMDREVAGCLSAILQADAGSPAEESWQRRTRLRKALAHVACASVRERALALLAAIADDNRLYTGLCHGRAVETGEGIALVWTQWADTGLRQERLALRWLEVLEALVRIDRLHGDLVAVAKAIRAA